MPITLTTVKRLFAKSGNKCAMPDCHSKLVRDDSLLVEICHIQAKRKTGPRFSPTLSVKERDEFPNLLLLCPTCHTLVDKNPQRYTVPLLQRIKEMHEAQGAVEISRQIATQAERVFSKIGLACVARATAKKQSVAVSIAGDNSAPINIKQTFGTDRNYPKNSIGADANMSNYMDYLCGLYSDYATKLYPTEKERWAIIGTAIKRKFRLKTRTRYYLSVDRFDELVAFLKEKLSRTPVGKRHIKNGTPLCRAFDEFRHGKM
ncbi:hypothetical protein M2447_002203 [Ereboglobus sp. PH5-10]|uniref:hypothetical protein n=1 Tax=Ereboglobus TaxID=2028344 RepID=UPI0012603C4D|nr:MULTISPECIES: hypothetical protein [Ereboglobus]MDF9828090.1 hypothetical protein [Ereboglobus sp. PH5-10]